MNVPAKIEKPMLLEFMADKYGLRPQEFSSTVRATCGMPNASAEEFAAFVMVCREHNLNPILREIYAYPKKGGGVVPVVSIDGWLNLINRHPQCDGFDFETHHDEKGALISMTCRIHRKDRSHPVEVTEYLSECIRPTEPWKMKYRMLRHKTIMQAGRYAFGFSGIYDDDDARTVAAEVDITPPDRPTPPRPPAPPVKSLSQPIEPSPMPVHDLTSGPSNQALNQPKPPVKRAPRKTTVYSDQATARYEPQTTGNAAPEPTPEPQPAIYDAETGEITNDDPSPPALLSSLDHMLSTAADADQIEEIWDGHDVEARFEGLDNGEVLMGNALALKRKHIRRLANG